MFDWITSFEFNSLLGIGMFWAPLGLCCYGYTVRTWVNYQKDKKNRATLERYYPTDTIGTLLGRALVSVVPIANLWAALFDVAPEVFGKFFDFLGKMFSQPLVPEKKGNKDV